MALPKVFYDTPIMTGSKRKRVEEIMSSVEHSHHKKGKESPAVSCVSAPSKNGVGSKIKCWGCKYYFGPPKVPNKFPKRDELWNLFTAQVDTIQIDTLAELMSIFHEEHIYEAELLAGNCEEAIPWSAAMIKEHLLEHMSDPRIIFKASLEGIRKMNRELESTMVITTMPSAAGGGEDNESEEDMYLEGEALEAAGALGESIQKKQKPVPQVNYTHVKALIAGNKLLLDFLTGWNKLPPRT